MGNYDVTQRVGTVRFGACAGCENDKHCVAQDLVKKKDIFPVNFHMENGEIYCDGWKKKKVK